MLVNKIYAESENFSADEIVSLTLGTYRLLSDADDLSPRNLAVNAGLSRYVKTLLRARQWISETDFVLNNERIMPVRQSLLTLLSRAESEMEDYFARHFLSKSALSLEDIDSFWYRDNYRALVRQEIEGLKVLNLSPSFVADKRPIAFVGAGPLPLSAIDYYLQTGRNCVCFDVCEESMFLGRSFIQRLGLEDAISYMHADGKDVDYSSYSLILVAALVQSKDRTLQAISTTARRSIMGVRSADGLMRLLYDSVDIEKVCTCGFDYAGTAYPDSDLDSDTINSTCFFTVPASTQDRHACAVHGKAARV